MSAAVARRLIVTGRVQGVGFRWWVTEQAQQLGLQGWVRNRRDGSVEIHAAGDEAAVNELEARCRTGPPAARVVDVGTAISDESVPLGFEQRPTV